MWRRSLSPLLIRNAPDRILPPSRGLPRAMAGTGFFRFFSVSWQPYEQTATRYSMKHPLCFSFFRRRLARALALAALIAVSGVAALLLATPSPLPDVRTWPVSPALLDARGELFHARLSSREEYCLPVPLDRMGPWLPLVAVAVEDKRFHGHFGMDILALARAVWQNLRAGTVVSGASTISSQVIRLTYPSARTWRSKVREFAQAVNLERCLSKREILELYLNRAPFGGPVRGVEAASRSYFGKKAAELSLAESALLIGMLRGPSVYRPDKNPEKTLERRNAILRQLRLRGTIPEERLRLALLEKLPPGRSAIPKDHRHFADIAFRALPGGWWEKGAHPVRTTLDPFLQNALERRLHEQLRLFPPQITAAGGIMDNRTGALAAYVGNARFDLDERRQWVDCGNAPRSPGSALKPFVYLRAVEQGRLLPVSLLADTPLSFAGEAPRNYDRVYRGPVSAASALANSLNAPAVRVLRMAGGEAVLQSLRDAGFAHLDRPAGHYGDSLALGGCEVTLLQTLQAYSTLATLGLRRPMTPLAEKARPGRLGESRLFSAAASFLITESLRETGRMSPVLRQALLDQGRAVAFKTGTSYGLRDAWTAAYTPALTVAVWLGDPEGRPHPGLMGLPVAAPMALAILRDIPVRPGEQTWYQPPENLERFTACALSGMPASPACPVRQQAWRIRDVTRTQPCAMHAVRAGGTETLLPAELEDYVTRRNTAFAAKERIDITAPLPGSTFFITPLAAEQSIALACEGAKGNVYWFIDQEFFGPQKKGASLLWPLKPGKHDISLVDEAGNAASARFTVVDILEKQPAAIPFAP